MEGVGARLGRSSTRYGPATVFSGPVRKWKKTWVPLSNPNSNASSNAAAANGGNATNNNHSHLILYKWTPISSRGNGGPAAPAATGKDPSAVAGAAAQPEEPPRRKFRFVPISVIEEQKQEAAVKSEEESKSSDADPSAQHVQADQSDGKPDMNDVSMEEAQDEAPAEDNKGTDLNLSLGLNTPDGDGEIDPKVAEQGISTGQLEKVNSGEDVEMKSGTNSETDNRLKRKALTPDLEMRM